MDVTFFIVFYDLVLLISIYMIVPIFYNTFDSNSMHGKVNEYNFMSRHLVPVNTEDMLAMGYVSWHLT